MLRSMSGLREKNVRTFVFSPSDPPQTVFMYLFKLTHPWRFRLKHAMHLLSRLATSLGGRVLLLMCWPMVF